MSEAAPRHMQLPMVESVSDTIEIDKPQHECGVFGVYAPGEPVAAMTVAGLTMSQHRGQSGAGMFVYQKDGTPIGTKDVGLVAKALIAAAPPTPDAPSTFDTFGSPIGVGHVRYSTRGGNSIRGVQPFSNSETKIVVSNNGEVHGLEKQKERYGVYNPDPASDSEDGFLTLNAATEQLGSLEQAMHAVLPEWEGAYCVVASDEENIYAARDPRAYHPLCIGVLKGGGYVVASETIVLESVGAAFLRDVEPGEIVTIGPEGISSSFMSRVEERKACMFEYLYTSHPASDLDGHNVYMSRVNAGHHLAETAPVEADIVIAVPESGRGAAEGFAEKSGIPLKQGIVLNREAKRTFIERGEIRDAMIALKYIPLKAILKGQRVVVCDDSVIKGNTMRQLVRMLRDAGATEVHIRSSAPRYTHPCHMGMDTGDPAELIAGYMTDKQIADDIGADSIAYNTVKNVEKSIVEAAVDPQNPRNLKLGEFCTGCATGEYPSGVPETVELGMPRIRTGRLALAGASA